MVNAHNFVFDGLDGGAPVALADFAGKALVLVNVASECGYTSQYRDLQQLYASKAAQGLVVVGAPCNDFGRQEPGPESEIASLASRRFGVCFPFTAKIEIVGARRHPFFDWVVREHGEAAGPRWNFHKFVIGRNGALVASFAPNVTPLSPKFLDAVRTAMAA